MFISLRSIIYFDIYICKVFGRVRRPVIVQRPDGYYIDASDGDSICLLKCKDHDNIRHVFEWWVSIIKSR